MSLLPRSLVLFGAGRMGGALLGGWVSGPVPDGAVTIVDPHPGADALALVEEHGLALNPPLAEIEPPEALVLAIKPQMLDAAAPALARLVGPRTLVLSILAGKRVGDLAARLPAARIIRAMPNTPAAVGRGITGLFAGPGAGAEDREHAERLMQAVGGVVWLEDEAQLDALTALSGSGPAYVFHLVEAMTAAGIAAGLPQEVAGRLARATVEGAGELLYRSPDTAAAVLRQNVTSPGGTTAAALEVLTAGDGLTDLMTRAVAAATRRAGELAG